MLLIVTIPPVVQAVNFDLSRRKVSTEESMSRWIQQNIPPDQPMMIEAPTIRLPPKFHYDHTNKLTHESLDAYRARGIVYLVASSSEEDKYFNDPSGHSADIAAYRRLFASTEIVKVISPTADNGPTLTVLRIPR